MRLNRPPQTTNACLASLLLFTAPGISIAQGPQAASSDNQGIVRAHREPAMAQPAEISAQAAAVIRLIARAQRQISAKRRDLEGATASLNRAAERLSAIQLSFFQAGLGDRSRTVPDLIPIYSSLSEIDDSEPHARGGQPRLRTAGRDERKEAGDAMLYVETDLPLKTTRQRIDEAREALSRDDITGAGKALSEARQQVVTVSLSLPFPLIQAKTALSRSVSYNLTGDSLNAAKSLADARFYLQRAFKTADKVTRQGVHELLSEMKDLQNAQSLESVTYQRRLDAVLARATALSQRAVDRLDNGWDRLPGRRTLKRDLIETRLQLAYAHIDRLLLNRQVVAQAELKAADQYLRHAAANADNALDSWLQGVALELTRLAHEPSPDTRTYEHLQQKLSQRISGH